jgi:aspartokinase/homoserine dehydrogenase 1
MKVIKFGGTSVGNPKNLEVAVSIIRNSFQSNELSAVVVSAFSGVTDMLLTAARQAVESEKDYLSTIAQLTVRHISIIEELFAVKNRSAVIAWVKNCLNELEEVLRGVSVVSECSLRVKDKVASYGEILSSYIIAELLKERGIPTKLIDSRSVIKTDSKFCNAEVDLECSIQLIRKNVSDNSSLHLFPGFIASDSHNDTTTLGRGGSDYTASIVGVALGASIIEIWTDVDGVMTADPRLVPDAMSIAHLSYEEAMELSHFGAKVIYPPTIQPAYKAKIPLCIRNTLNPQFKGTLIDANPVVHNHKITGISSIGSVSLVRIQGSGMQGISGTAKRVFGALASEDVNVILISQASSEHTICIAIDPTCETRALCALNAEFESELSKSKLDPIVVQDDCSIISIVGENMRSLPGISSGFFYALGRNGINVLAIAQGSSELNISVVINASDRKKALNAVHEGFFLSKNRKLHIFVAGGGLIGSTLLTQIYQNETNLIENYNTTLSLCGVTNTKQMLIDDAGISWNSWQELLNARGESSNLDVFIKKIIDLNLPNSVFVDCSASDIIPKLYPRLLDANISVVTPNKKGLAGDIEIFREINKSKQTHGSIFLYETSVGAGLPVISTLKDLIKSGDDIIEIQAVLSGTLSYIFNNFNPDVSFSDVVKKAAQLGFTEPDPRDDLSGLDVGRKLLILAREMGLELNLSDINIENLVPKQCRDCSKEEFISKLSEFDSEIVQKNSQAHKNGGKLCYMGQIVNGKCSATLQVIYSDHPFYSLSGSDNIILFKTRRYDVRPLVVRGPGAGADVTAAGVFADILRVAV